MSNALVVMSGRRSSSPEDGVNVSDVVTAMATPSADPNDPILEIRPALLRTATIEIDAPLVRARLPGGHTSALDGPDALY